MRSTNLAIALLSSRFHTGRMKGVGQKFCLNSSTYVSSSISFGSDNYTLVEESAQP